MTIPNSGLGNTSELTATQQNEQVVDSRMVELLNNREFVEFLTKYPEEDQIRFQDDFENHPESMLAIKEVFDNSKVVAEKVGNFIKTELSERLGVRIPPDTLKYSKEFILEQAIYNPDYINAAMQAFEEADALNGEIAQLEQQINTVGTVEKNTQNIQSLEEKKALFERAKGRKFSDSFEQLGENTTGGLAGAVLYAYRSLKRYTDARETIQKEHGYKLGFFDKMPLLPSIGINKEVSKIEEQIQLAQAARNTSELLEQTKQEKIAIMQEKRSNILGNLADERVFNDMMSNAIRNKMADIVDGQDLESGDEGVEFINRLQDLEDVIDVDFEANKDRFTADIDGMTRFVVAKELEAIISKTVTGNKPLDKMLAGIRALHERKNIGNIEGDNVQQVVEDTLEEIITTLPANDPKAPAKRLLLSQVRRMLK